MMPQLKDNNGKVIAEVTAADVNQPGCDEGVWVEMKADDGTKPTICFVKDKPGGPQNGGWYLGFYRDTNNAGPACDFAICFDKKDGPILQVTRGDEVKQVSLFDLLEKKS